MGAALGPGDHGAYFDFNTSGVSAGGAASHCADCQEGCRDTSEVLTVHRHSPDSSKRWLDARKYRLIPEDFGIRLNSTVSTMMRIVGK